MNTLLLDLLGAPRLIFSFWVFLKIIKFCCIDITTNCKSQNSLKKFYVVLTSCCFSGYWVRCCFGVKDNLDSLCRCFRIVSYAGCACPIVNLSARSTRTHTNDCWVKICYHPKSNVNAWTKHIVNFLSVICYIYNINMQDVNNTKNPWNILSDLKNMLVYHIRF